MKKKSTGLLTKLLTVVFACAIVGGLGWYYYDLDKTRAQLGDDAQFTDTIGTEQNEDKPIILNSTDTVFAKLSSGKPVHIAVVGDTFGKSVGATAGNEWATQLERILETTYNSDVTVDDMCVAVTGAYQGYCTVMTTDWTDYDLALVCFGSIDQTDKLNLFQRNYEAILRNLHRRNRSMAVMPIISTYVTESEFSGTIRDLAQKYEMTYVNMNNAFVDSGKKESELKDDKLVYPNDDGYLVYAKAIASAIDEDIKNGKVIRSGAISARYDEVKGLDYCKMVEKSAMTDEGGSEYSFKGAGALVGVAFIPNDDSLTVRVNGKTVATLDAQSDQGLTHYESVAAKLDDDDEITVVAHGDAELVGLMVSNETE